MTVAEEVTAFLIDRCPEMDSDLMGYVAGLVTDEGDDSSAHARARAEMIVPESSHDRFRSENSSCKAPSSILMSESDS